MATDFEVAIDCLNTYGFPAQLRKAAEEFMELAVECIHVADGTMEKPQKIAEEMADVRFMLLQLQMIFEQVNPKFGQIVDTAYKYKVDRTDIMVKAEIEKRKMVKNDTNTATDRPVENDSQ